MAMELLEVTNCVPSSRPDTRCPRYRRWTSPHKWRRLAYAHERHIVHRDIKRPTSWSCATPGEDHDFGHRAHATNDVKTMTGMILGSPKYMSPEQVAGSAPTIAPICLARVVLHEMLTGQPPFQADTVHGLMYQTLNSTPTARVRAIPNCPRS